MKQLTNYQRVTNYLVKVFKAVNDEYFQNELETPTITIHSSVGAYGHITTSKIWNNGGTATYELNISADYLNRPIENVVATLIHEACHLYAMMHDIQDTSNRGVYHNKRFKQIAENIGGLIIDKHDKYGWTITSPSESTLDFCISNGFEDILINRDSFPNFGGFTGGISGNSDNLPKVLKPSSTRKYMCPCCGNSFRATKNINVLCMDCNEPFVLVR